MFYFILGFSNEADKFFLFFTFVFLGLCSFTFLGQMLVSLFRDSQTAQGFGGLVVSFSSLFSGILIRPGETSCLYRFLKRMQRYNDRLDFSLLLLQT